MTDANLFSRYNEVMQAEDHAQALRQAVLDMAAYFAVFKLPVSIERLVSLLPIKANHLGVQAAVRQLIASRQLVAIGDCYGLKRRHYATPDQLTAQAQKRQLLLEKAHRMGRLIGLLPFVKSVVVINSVAIGNVHDESDIDLLIVTTPSRVFIAKGLLWKLFRWTHQIETAEFSAGQFSLGMFLTTRGVPMERDMMKVNQPHLVYWLMTGVPVYGARRWLEILHASKYIQSAVPNYIWPTGGRTIDRSGWAWLDKLDERGYRQHLKHTSLQEKNQRPEAFIRLRPDIINLHALDKSGEIAAAWDKLRVKIKS